MHITLAMTRCSECGAETVPFINGTPVCTSCDGKRDGGGQAAAPSFPHLPEAVHRLEVARNEYRLALWAQREALALRHSLDQNNCDGSVALHNANLQLEKAAASYDEALRQFVAEQANLRRSS
jgi:hypothetical protein